MKGLKTGGRTKGTPNKFHKTVKENILAVFDAIGGQEAMAVWASENRTDFYRLFNVHKDSDKDALGGSENKMHMKIELP